MASAQVPAAQRATLGNLSVLKMEGLAFWVKDHIQRGPVPVGADFTPCVMYESMDKVSELNNLRTTNLK
jgi:hypothetical protein